jgi:hypothetical protein
MVFKHTAKFVVSVVVSALPILVCAQVYTWKDANGRTHFSDQPQIGADAKQVRGNIVASEPEAPRSGGSTPSASASSPKTSGPKSWEDQDRDFKQRKAEQAEAEAKAKKEKEAKAEKDRYCTSLRNNLAMLERGGRMSRPDAKGEREFLDDSQIKAEASRIRDQISRDCK